MNSLLVNVGNGASAWKLRRFGKGGAGVPHRFFECGLSRDVEQLGCCSSSSIISVNSKNKQHKFCFLVNMLICLSVCLSIAWSVCLSVVYMFCLSVSRSVCLSVCQSISIYSEHMTCGNRPCLGLICLTAFQSTSVD